MKVKQISLVFISVLFFSCNKENLECLPTGLKGSIIAYYPFNNGSLTDESGNGNDFTNSTNASPSADRDGNTNCAFLFDNSQQDEQFLTTTNSDFLNGLSKFSISAWYEPHPGQISGLGYQVIFSRGTDTRCPNRRGEWSLGLYDCRRAVFGHNNSVWAFDTAASNNCSDEVDALVDKWHHVVAIKDNDEYKIYFNGVLNETDTGNADCGNRFKVAEDIGDAFIGHNFTGRIDDIIIYDKALSQNEVTKLFETSTCCK